MTGYLLFPLTLLVTSAVAMEQVNQIPASDSGFAEVNGTKLYWETAGIGETIVFIHGSFGDSRFWDNQIKAFSKKYQVLRYDLRGYGRSALPQPDQSYSDAKDLKALLDFLEIDKAHLCGLSLGSIVAIDFALAYPNKCNSLIACGARVAGDDSGEYRTPYHDTVSVIIQQAIAILKAKGTREATDYLWSGQHAMGKCIVSSQTRMAMTQMGYEYTWWRYLHANKRELIFPDGIKELNTIWIPTLVVTAPNDLELCKHIAEIMVKEMPHAKLISIKNAGHMMNMDNPAQFNNSVSNFIRNVQRK